MTQPSSARHAALFGVFFLRSATMPFDFDRLDRGIGRFMRRWGTRGLRIALAVVYVWFGILKPLGLSPADQLVERTVAHLPPFSPKTWVVVLGCWEVLISVTILFRRTQRLAIGLLLLQMIGTFLPLVLLPEVTFQPERYPYAPTLVGQYILKNLLFVAAALVVGGTVRDDERA